MFLSRLVEELLSFICLSLCLVWYWVNGIILLLQDFRSFMDLY